MTCGTKQRYGSQREALDALRRMRRFRNESYRLRALAVYWCPLCGGWHVGHSRQKPGAIATPVKKVPSTGELQRRIKRLQAQLDRERSHHVYLVGIAIAKEQAAEAELEREKQQNIAFQAGVRRMLGLPF